MDTPLSSNIAPVRVLVVDDHPSTATTLARAISQLGPAVEVLSAESGEQALGLTKNQPVDLLITDMVMPGMNGLELIEKMRSQPNGIPAYTALITAYDVSGLKETARRLNVNEVIMKPVRPERICQIVANTIKDLGHAPVSQAVEIKPQLRILVADDQPDNVALLCRYLASEGFVCVTASNGAEALTAARAENPDLVLLDVNMPVMDGFQTLQELRADPAIGHIPVIILTAARLEPVDLQYALNMGADDYLTKPFDRRELMARIRTRLRVKEAEDVIRRRNRELNLLPEIGRELSARLDVNELMDVVLRRTVETLGALLGHIILLTPDGPLYKSHRFSMSASPDPQGQMPFLNALLDQVREIRQGFIIRDVSKDSRWQAGAGDQTRSVIVVPMLGRLNLLGMLALVHEQPDYFNVEHKLLLQAIASQASIALENAQLLAGGTLEQQRNELLTTTTHDMKNPLTMIALTCQMIPKAGPLNDKQMEFVNQIISTVKNMDGLLQNIIDLASLENDSPLLKRERVDVNELVSGVCDEYQLQAEARQQTFQLETAHTPPCVMGNPYQLRHALQNLVDNAIRYTPAGGAICLSVEMGAHQALIRVKDSGCGIPPGDQPHIFERFYRAHSKETEQVTGSGLGLAIVKAIVERSDGHVDVESEYGKGSCFTISLPLCASA